MAAGEEMKNEDSGKKIKRGKEKRINLHQKRSKKP